jgi:integrase
MNIKVNGKITLAKRKNTKFWQAVLKAPDGCWRRISTKTKNEDEATQFAFEKLAEWHVLENRGIPIVTARKFKYAAERYKKQLQTSIEAGVATKSQATYKGIIDNWLIPFFCDFSVKNIDQEKLFDFEIYRREKMGREPAKGTINKHNIVLRAVLEYSSHQKWCKTTDIPKLTIKGKGRPAERRGYFEPKEFNDLMKFMVSWRNSADKYISKYKRDVLRLYVYFLVATGMRPGTELNNIRWSNFQHVQKGKSSKSYYRLYVMEGKKQGRLAPDQTKQSTRTVMVSEEAYKFIVLLKEKRTNVKDDDLVFCMPDGEPITGLSEMFRNCLTLCGLRYSKAGGKRSLYSCRHTYATWKLQKGDLTYEQLKRQMGTSVMMLEKHYDHAVSDAYAEDLIV